MQFLQKLSLFQSTGSVDFTICVDNIQYSQQWQQKKQIRLKKKVLIRSAQLQEQTLQGGKDLSNRQKANLDWDKLGFGIENVAPLMYKAVWNEKSGQWNGNIEPYKNIELPPSAQVLNYGAGLFEGLKAQETSKGNLVIFRPDLNAKRLSRGCDRMVLPSIGEKEFVEHVSKFVESIQDYVPPYNKGSLYIRPILFGSGPVLGLSRISPEATFIIYATPVGLSYFGKTLVPTRLGVNTDFHRSAPKGMGNTKFIGNYAPVLKYLVPMKQQGYDDLLFLDSSEEKYVEEVATSNLFIVKDKTLYTPSLSGSILPGVTRQSVLDLAPKMGYKAVEKKISIEEALEADEFFATGTAVQINPVGSVTYKGQKYTYGKEGECTAFAKEVYHYLKDITMERRPDEFGWLHKVC